MGSFHWSNSVYVYFQKSAVAKHFVALSTNAVSTALCHRCVSVKSKVDLSVRNLHAFPVSSPAKSQGLWYRHQQHVWVLGCEYWFLDKHILLHENVITECMMASNVLILCHVFELAYWLFLMLNAHVLVGRRTLLAVVGYRFVHRTAHRYVCCVNSPIRPETCCMQVYMNTKPLIAMLVGC